MLKQDRKNRTCPLYTHRIINPGLPPEEFDAFYSDDEERSYPVEDEHHAIFDCSAYADAQEQCCDLFQSHITIFGAFLNQPQCNRLAKFLFLDQDAAYEQSLVRWVCAGPKQTSKQSIGCTAAA